MRLTVRCEGAISLTEAMQEKQVTIGDTTFKLDRPFFLANAKPNRTRRNYQLPASIVSC
jgi:MoxR-like ATPase